MSNDISNASNEHRRMQLQTLLICSGCGLCSERRSELDELSKGSRRMESERQRAMAEFWRILKWILLIAILMVAGALAYLYIYSSLDLNTVVAVTLGVFFSVLLGCGLFAAAFFSDKSGTDEDVANVTKSERDKK